MCQPILPLTVLKTARKNQKPIYKIINIYTYNYLATYIKENKIYVRETHLFLSHTATKSKKLKYKNIRNTFVKMVGMEAYGSCWL